MDLIRTYIRALSLLGPEARLGWFLSAGNLGVAAAAFIEPVLFGRIIDTLASSPQADGPPTRLAWLLAAWVGFGMFAIAAGVSVALFADRLAHRRRQSVLASYFEHVMQLPLAFPATPSPRRRRSSCCCRWR